MSLHSQTPTDDICIGLRCDGKCLEFDKRCDGSQDCSEGEDEQGCISSCYARSDYLPYQCQSGECILSDLLCDGQMDCEDGSDEERFCARSGVGVFFCESGQCINAWAVCNGEDDCDGGDDEQGCNDEGSKVGSQICFGRKQCKGY
ncbi:hypothetical protein CAPTEDRAFT_141753 [Capitella teleta]|uniref:Uncharacterized protein n=1 Tax=Capitella teleta TaxID=283909 RepID=R7V1N4_CAPTE|nr:hypothetical protein CAPTEDRAFT_141753 [Capitella teleta]|eukprot:ELU10226.1 hypothetical protein CAPTEDRAFT_141753 [Capitella teleta]